MSYAIFESGGKQYIAREGETVDIDRLAVEVGSDLTFDQVLMTSQEGDVRVGTPTVSGSKVVAEVVDQVKGPKVMVFKFKPKVRYRRRQGHRQLYTRVRIESIKFPGGKKKAAAKKAKEKEPKAKKAKPKADEIDLNSMLKTDLEKLAEELGVTPEEGSGAGGNVLVKDLREAIRAALEKDES